MKKILFLFLIIAINWGCKKDDIEIKGITVNLITTDDSIIFKKSVILYDQSDYRIKTLLDTFISGYPFLLDGYGDMKTKAINDGKIKDILIVSDYMKYLMDSIYTLAYYMENGKCNLFDKLAKKSILSIQVETYFEGEPMASTGGRRFYIKNKLFLETVDMISK
jgi:hypothetical protein